MYVEADIAIPGAYNYVHTFHLNWLLPETLSQSPEAPAAPLSPDEAIIVTPCTPSFMASLLKVSKVLAATNLSLAPHDMELEEGGYSSSDTSRIHDKNESPTPVYQ